jgi:hypothetical protein
MTLADSQMDSFGLLGRALGILGEDGAANPTWFEDPVGNGSNAHGLRDLLRDDGQREALVAFVDEVLGPPQREEHGQAVWVPLFRNATPQVTIYAVIEARGDVVHVGVGFEHATIGAAPTVETRLHARLFQLARGSATPPPDSEGLPGWLLIGRPAGTLGITVDAKLRDSAPPAGEAGLGGLTLALEIPTSAAGNFSVKVDLKDLQLPGAASPRTFTLDADSIDELGSDVFALLVGLIRAQADAIDPGSPSLRPFAALTGLLGLRGVSNLPPLPIEELPTQGINAIVQWLESVVEDTSSRNAWIGQLALLFEASANPARSAVEFNVGLATIALGLRVEAGSFGHPTLTPWTEFSLVPQAGASVALHADLFRADTGTGQILAFPDLAVEAIFGADAGGAALLSGTPQVGSLHLGIGLNAARQPAFRLTLHDVSIVSGAHHDVLDLSSPQAALDSADSVIAAALNTALEALGDAGPLVSQLIGVAPPSGAGIVPAIEALHVTRLLADPLAEIGRYWQALTANSTAMATVLGSLRRLLLGGVEGLADGLGTEVSPWIVDFTPGVGLRFWLASGDLVVALGASVATPVLDGFEAKAAFGITLLHATFAPLGARFGVDANLALSLQRVDRSQALLDLGAIALELDSLVIGGTWSPGTGLRAKLGAQGLNLRIDEPAPVRIGLPLPSFNSAGQLVLAAPNWNEVENGIAALLSLLHLPVIQSALDLLGWSGSGPRLHLEGLFGGSADVAIKNWIADLALDCTRVRQALGPVAALLSGFSRSSPLGLGQARNPFFCPISGDPHAPGLAAWLKPGCPIFRDPTAPLVTFGGGFAPEPDDIVAELSVAAHSLPDVADLLVGRTNLAEGLRLLTERFAGTDGLVGAPASLPPSVQSVELSGLSYDELVAFGSIGELLGDVFETMPSAIVHIGCEATWSDERSPGSAFDAATSANPGAIPASATGTWTIRLPTPQAAAAMASGRTGIDEQAQRIRTILAARTQPITAVAYGGAAAALLRAAASTPAISQIVTVGAPWAGLAVDSLRTGLSGDALLLCERLLAADAVKWRDALLATQASPLQTMRGVIARAIDVLADEASLPDLAGEPLPPSASIRAVFGALEADTISEGLRALLQDGTRARLKAALAAAAPEPAHDALALGLRLPVIDLNLGGLLIGAGATLELCTLERDGTGVRIGIARSLMLDLHLGVHDGWLLGGPGASQRDNEVRWMSVHLDIPFDSTPGSAEFVLHEARGLGAYRESWVVRSDADGVAATLALPEVRAILSGVIARTNVASPELASLFEWIGISAAGGLDPSGLDRLLHDTKACVSAAMSAAPAGLASLLRTFIPAAGGVAAQVNWTVGPATLGLDLAAKSISAALAIREVGLPPLSVGVQWSPASAGAEFSVGELDAFAGGLRLHGRAGTFNDLALEWQAPAAAVRRMGILPTFDASAIESFVTVVLPAALARGVLTYCHESSSTIGRAAIEAATDVLGLLRPADAIGQRAFALPLGLFDQPGAWLVHATENWRTDPVNSAIRLLDALAPIVAPSRGATPGWPLAPGIRIHYAGVEGRLELAIGVELESTVESTAISTALLAGLSIANDGTPLPVLSASVRIAGRGAEIALSPHLRIALLRPLPNPALEIYPHGPGLGEILSAAGEMVVPPVLNAIVAHRSDVAASVLKDVGEALFQIGGAMELLEAGSFTAPRISAFAADPAGRLLVRLPHLIASGLAALASALDPGASVVHVSHPSGGPLTLGFGTAQALRVVFDGSGAGPSVTLQGEVDLPGIRRLEIEGIRLAADGVQVALQLGALELAVGGMTLRPLLRIRAGVASGSFTRMVALGLALDELAQRAVEVRWALNETPPNLALVTFSGSSESVDTTPAAVAGSLLALGASMATTLLVNELGPVLTPTAKSLLQGVVFTDVASSVEIDPGLFLDLIAPEALFVRLQRMLWNAATSASPLSLTIDSAITIGMAAKDLGGGRKHLGLAISLAPGKTYTIASGDPNVSLEIDASWINPPVAGGLAIYLVAGQHHADDSFTFELEPGVEVGGIGLRFSKTAGPLLALGPISLDAIALHLYGAALPAGIGGGVQIELAGFSIAPSGAGGSNSVANGIMADAGASSPSNRPTFSPAIAIQHHPGDEGVAVSLRAGPPPGPWWLTVQRQLGPLYLERFGFDSVEQGGTITRISLLFDGRVSLFGLTASVDQLSISWLGGDVFDARSWAVDLQGLAISADMSGVSLSGGLLKRTENGNISYVGQLLGRFGIYGLSVFGGYTLVNGSPSFFIFGAFNGPIGGPPAFFVTGIGGGFAINRGLLVPSDFSGFADYPFIKALNPAAAPPSDPMAELRRLGEYFPVALGNFWFAAGISFTCFSLIDGIAVISVAFGDGLDINLLGLARMALPRPGAALISIELGLIARFSTREGIFSIRAQLTDNSWLLYPDVRLTGGFAFVVWWKGPNRGQFVLSLGGYHPNFHRDGYPEVPRLGLCWQVTPQIVIKGGAYFALTSEALMAGVDIEVSADFGFVWAKIGFGAHGLVYFDPFWFEVSAYARIAAGLKIETWFGTIRFSISIGANVRVWGPEFSGEATIEIGPVSFTVGFGSDRAIEGRALPWSDFVDKYLEAVDGSARVLSAITGKGTLPASPEADGPANTADGTAERPFEVFAEFELTITTTVPTKRFAIKGSSVRSDFDVVRSDGAPARLGLKPMKARALESVVELHLEEITGETVFARLTELKALRRELRDDAFPIGAWGEPDGQSSPALPKGDVLFAANGIRLTAEATMPSPGPEIDFYRVEAARRPLPLQAQNTSRIAVRDLSATVAASLLEPSSALEALQAAKSTLYLDAAAGSDFGNGSLTALSRAAFIGDRSAPPLFGTLADGLAIDNAPVAEREVQPKPVRPAFAGTRPPRVEAVLAAGLGVAPRLAHTSVANRKIKRRPAPTLDSVHSRLGVHLPIDLKVQAMPATTLGKTVIPTGAVPRTEAPGTTRTFVAGRVGGIRGLDSIVSGLTSAKRGFGAASAPSLLAAGEILVMRLPDSTADVNDQRPALALSAPARVVMLHGDGSVALDAGHEGQVSVPEGVATIAVVPDAAAVHAAVPKDGLDGWHAGTRVAALGTQAALAPGSVLTIEGGAQNFGHAWVIAGDFVQGASTLSTRFAKGATTLAIVVANATLERQEPLALELIGATRKRDRKGQELAPIVVLRGSEAALIYDISATSEFTVRVRLGGPHAVTAMLAGDESGSKVAQVISAQGVTVVAARTLAATGKGAYVAWRRGDEKDPLDTPPRTLAPAREDVPIPRKSAAKKTASAKSAAQPKTPAKTQAKKSSRKSGG